MLSWKLILCAALLAVAATAQKPDVVIDDGAVLVDETAAGDYIADYAAPAPEGDYAATGDYDVDYAAAAPGTGDYAEDYAAAPGTGDYEDYTYAAAPAVAPVVKPTAAAPAAAPVAPKPLTIGALVGSVCPGIADVLAGPDFSTLVSLLERDEIANTVITLPKGVVVIAAPTNTAFEPVIKAVGAAAIANNTIIGEILANHIAVAANASASTATALSGETLAFWTIMGGVGGNPAPTPASIAGLAATSKDGVITDNGGVPEAGKVVGAVSCGATGPFAFAVDQVLLPTKYAIKPTVAAPAPAPAPSSASFKASAAFAAIAGAVALVM